MRRRLGISGLTAAAALGFALLPTYALAQGTSLKQEVVGAWILRSAYEVGQNGRKTESWGPGVQGTLMLSPGDRFALEIMSADRPKSSAPPRTPVGKAIAFFGTYSVNDANKTLTEHIERATFPNWDGISRTATIAKITANELELTSAPVNDQELGGTIVPHLSFERAR